MKIAMIAPFEESVPPQKYGGIELVVSNLTERLVKMGHSVTLLASGDSRTRAKLQVIFPRAIRSLPEAQNVQLRDALKYQGIGKVVAYLQKNTFDIIHNHTDWRLLSFRELLASPMVTTVHGRLDTPYEQKVHEAYADANFISISLNQRKPMPQLNFVANVYNGIETDTFRFHEKPQDYFAFLGRMSPEKGPLEAIEIARKSGVKLIMAAKVDAVDKEFFEERVHPLIDDDHIQFIGEVRHDEKVELLGNAKAIIAPIQWEEPFGLFFVEAMACGTPVIAMRRGSVPEIIKHGETGFICTTNDEAVERVHEIEKIDRMACYTHVRENFTALQMAQGYYDAYEKILGAAQKKSTLLHVLSDITQTLKVRHAPHKHLPD